MSVTEVENYSIKYYVRISEIEKYFDDAGKEYCFSFTYTETNSANVSHTKFYYSSNYTTLSNLREKLSNKTKELKKELNRGCYTEGIKLKPTLLDRIKNKFRGNTK